MSAHWTSASPGGQLVWRRRLGNGEEALYWDSVISGSFDILQHFELKLDRSRLDVMEPDNIRMAWLAVKKHFPMVAANFVREKDDEVYFEISDERIHSIGDRELDIVGSVDSKEEASAIVGQFLSGPRQLRSDVNVRLIIRSENYKASQSRREPNRFHFFFLASHALSDGFAQASLFTTFTSMLTTPSRRIPRASIEERLAMVPNGETIPHKSAGSIARRRWLKAIASVLLQAKFAKTTGGQLLPNKMQSETFFTTPKSRSYGASLSLERSSAVLKNCRAQGITFGSVVMPLCQIAQARILHRRRHMISPDEWEQKTKVPMHYNGPMSRRPKMPEEWKKKGGMTEFFMLIGVYQCTLPRMPSCNSSTDPSYEELISRASFRNRCVSVQKQTDEYVNHPLFHEMISLFFVIRLENRKRAAKLWEKKQRGEVTQQDLEELAEYLGSFPFITTCSASSHGSLEDTVAKEFPLPSDDEKPFLKLYNMDTHLRALGGDIYLTIMGNFGRLWVWCWWDENAYDAELIKEWVDEVAKAADFYLGEDKDESTATSGNKARL